MTTVPLPFTRPPLSLNDRGHWRPRAQKIAGLRAMARTLAVTHKVPPMEAAVVTLVYRPRDRRARDAANMHATLKPITDGLVDAGRLTRGDSSEYVEERCRIEPAVKGQPAALWLEITPKEAP